MHKLTLALIFCLIITNTFALGGGYKINHITIAPDDFPIKSIFASITGKVTDENGQPVKNVSIIIVGSQKGTSTDETGAFTINADAGQTLELSAVGYKTIRNKFNGSNNVMNIVLLSDIANLNDVVVVGYGTQKKTSLTNSVVQIGGSDLTRRPVSNLQQSMQGLAAGVTVLDRGGAPGRSNATIRVRGITTFNINNTSTSGYGLGKNDALVIVDGIEQRLTDINPDDIESISVLKDASSTAIYGSRATNGVILHKGQNSEFLNKEKEGQFCNYQTTKNAHSSVQNQRS